MYGVIYKITCITNGKIYVGQTTLTIQERFNVHSKTDSLLGKDIRSFGKENFKIEVIEEGENADQLNERERFWIKEFDCKFPHGYNTMNGGSCIANAKIITNKH